MSRLAPRLSSPRSRPCFTGLAERAGTPPHPLADGGERNRRRGARRAQVPRGALSGRGSAQGVQHRLFGDVLHLGLLLFGGRCHPRHNGGGVHAHRGQRARRGAAFRARLLRGGLLRPLFPRRQRQKDAHRHRLRRDNARGARDALCGLSARTLRDPRRAHGHRRRRRLFRGVRDQRARDGIYRI